MLDNSLAFLDCAVHIEEDRSCHIDVYRNTTHTDQYLFFDSQPTLRVIRTLQQTENVSTGTEVKEEEEQHLEKVLKAYYTDKLHRLLAKQQQNSVRPPQ